MKEPIYESNHKNIIRYLNEYEKHIHYLNQLYVVLAQTNKAIVQCPNEEALMDEICRIAVDFGGMKMSWIGRPEEEGRFSVLSSYGSSLEYLEDIFISSDCEVLEGRGPCGVAFREKRVVISKDYLKDETTQPWQEKARKYGWRAGAAIPIERGGRPYAVLSVYHSDANIFDIKMISLLGELAANISYALDRFDMNHQRIIAEDRLRLYAKVFEQSHEGIIITDINANILSVNKAFTELTGFQEDEVIGRNPNLLSSGRQDGEFYQSMWDAIHETGYWQGEVWNRRKDGSEYAERLSISHIVDAQGKITNYIGILSDITQRLKAEKDLLEAQQRLINIIDFLPDATFVIDNQGKIIAWNKAIEKLTGVKKEDMLGKGNYEYSVPIYHRRHPILIDLAYKFDEQKAKHYPSIYQTQKDVLIGESMTEHLRPENTYLWSIASVLRDTQGEVMAGIQTIRDVTQQKEAEAKIQHLAYYDALTDLPNRALLRERVNEAIKQAELNEESLAIMFFDLDHFKNINDTLGHRIGDLFLIEQAKRLKSIFQNQEVVYRLSGDEFIILLSNVDEDRAARAAENVIREQAKPFHIEGHELVVTPSIGIAVSPGNGSDFETLYKCADIAVYYCKKESRNSYRFFNPEMQLRSVRQVQLENALRKALEREQLRLFYQPQISLTTGKVVGLEALVRWEHPEFGLVSPMEFIPLAEESGLILPIGEWVLRTAIQQMKNWLEQGIAPMCVAVNLSAVQLREKNITQIVRNLLEEANLPAEYLELEVTESVAMSEPEKAIEVLDELHALGVSIAIDDFGTGYSSLAYLTRFKINKLKIDQSFVRKVGTHAEAEVIIDTIISLTQSLNLKTIAEGVETEQHLKFLRDKGCGEVQGYYFSQPKPAEEIQNWLQEYIK